MLFRQKKYQLFFLSILLLAAFFVVEIKKVEAAFDPAVTYSKTSNGQLSADEWNNLQNDFVRAWGSTTAVGGIGIGIAPQGTDINGLVASSTIKTNTSFLGSLSAAYVTPGAFNSIAGTGGNFSFPASVGIGATPANAKLQLSGSDTFDSIFRLTNTGTSGGDYFMGVTNSGWTAGGNKLIFGVGIPASANVKMVLAANGNVGIGTSTPDNKLTISGGSIVIDNNYGYRARLSSGASANLMKYDTGNNAIIGPNSELKLNGSFSVQVPNNGNVVITGGAADSSSAIGTKINTLNNLTTAGSKIISFQNNNSEKAFIGYNGSAYFAGNVGIGTTNPLEKLDIVTATTTAYQSISHSAYGSIASPAISGIKFKGLNNAYNIASIEGLTRAVNLSYGALRFNVASNVGSGVIEERMRIEGNTGNVGIGTTTPQYKLDVAGEGNFNGNYIHGVRGPVLGTDAANRSYVDTLMASTSAGIITQIATSSLWQGSLTGAIYNNNTGNVGIGTTAPSSPLTVSASSTGIVGRFSQLGAWTGSNYALYVDDGDYSYLSGFRIETPGGLRSLFAPGGQAIGFATAGDSAITFTQSTSVERMRIAAGGNLGIGTTTPGSLLTVGNNLGLTALGTIYGATSTRYLDLSGVLPNALSAPGDIYSTAGVLKADGAGNSYVMGKLGVRTSNPGGNLSVDVGSSSDMRVNGLLVEESGAKVASIGDGGASGSQYGYLGLYSTGDVERVRLYAYGNNWIAPSNGNVGIGTTNPGTYKLNVSGKIYVEGADRDTTGAGRLIYTWKGLELHANHGHTGESAALDFTNNNGYLSRIVGYGAGTGNGGHLLFFTSPDHTYAGMLERMVITNSGNVGIGSTTPNYKFVVNGDASFSGYQIHNVGAPATGTDVANRNYVDSVIAPAATTTVGLQSGFWTTGAGSSIYNNNTGNVGVGTINPISKLNVYSNGSSTKLIVNGDDGVGNNGGIEVQYYLDGLANRTRAKLGISGYVGYLDLFNGSSVKNVEITAGGNSYFNGGNVGIGTTTPGSLLTVGNNLGLTAGGAIYGATSTRYLDLAGVLGDSLSVPNDIHSTAGELKIDGTGNSYVMGNLGIGTTNPNTNLELAGSGATIRLSDSVSKTPAIEFLRGAGAFGSDVWGDYKIQNIGSHLSFIGGESDINNGNPVTYMTLSATGNLTVSGTGNSSFAGKVGVGTIAPYAGLEIANTGIIGSAGYAYGLLIKPSNTGLGARFAFTSGVNPEGSRKVVLMGESSQNLGDFTILTSANANLPAGTGTFSNRFIIQNSGNVGIGTTTPDAKLNVNGTFHVSGAFNSVVFDKLADVSGSRIVMTDSSGALYATSTSVATGLPSPSGISGQTLRSNGTSWIANNLLYNNGTNVGIGTTSPTAKLHIVNNDTVARVIVESSVAQADMLFGSAWGNTKLRFDADSGGNYIQSGNYAFNGNRPLEFSGYNGNQGSVVNFDFATSYFSGNVGIGTTTPSASLDIFGNFKITNGGLVYNTNNSYRFNFSDIFGDHNSLIAQGDINTAGVLETAGTDRPNYMLGKLGVGTTAPGGKAEIAQGMSDYGTSFTEPHLKLKATSMLDNTGFVGITYDASTSANYGWSSGALRSTNGQSSFVWKYHNNSAVGTEYMRISQNGSVGIGTTTPNAALDIFGKAKITNNGIIYNTDSSRWLDMTGANADSLRVSGNLITTDGKVGIGTTNPESKLTVSLAGQAVSADFLSGTIPLGLLSGSGQNIISGIAMSSNAPAERGILQFRKSRGTVLSPTAVVNGDTIASFSSGGYSGNSTIFSSQIDFVVDGAVSTTEVPQRISFLTGTTVANRTERLIINSSGNVGIGTTNPLKRLTISADSDGDGVVIKRNNAGAGTYADLGFLMTTSNVEPATYLRAYRRTSYNDNDLLFHVGASDAMYIKSNGNVGIGTTTPSTKLYVNGVVTATGGFSGPLTGTVNAANISKGIFGTNTGQGTYSFGGVTANGDSHYQWEGATYRNPGDYTPQINIRQDNATTGINGFKPALTLYNQNGDLNSTIGLDFSVRETTAAGNATALAGIMAIKESAGTSGAWTQGGLLFYTKNMGTRVDALRILNNGNVGIGVDPGNFKLKVAGNVAITGTLQTMTGSDFAEEFTVSSPLEAGTVVVMGDLGYKSVKACGEKFDSTVVGVVSDNPSIIAGRVDSKHKVVVAMAGVVKVKVSDVNGKIKKGSMLTTSNISGYAMKADSAHPGTIIGKALENLSGQQGEIKVLINLQ